jgi:hypothetical protein
MVALFALVACGGESRTVDRSASGGHGNEAAQPSGDAAVGGGGGNGAAGLAQGGSAAGVAQSGGTTSVAQSGGTTGVAQSGGTTGVAQSGGAAGVAQGAGTGGGLAMGGTGTSGAPNESSIDDVDHSGGGFDTGLPPNSGSGFVWAEGLGNWFVTSPPPDQIQGDAQAADIVPPRGDSTKAYRVQGSGHDQGVDLFAQLHHPQGDPADLSAYAGIAFWTRLDGSSGQLVVALTPSGRYFGAVDPVPSVELSVSNEWQNFELPFEAFGTDGHAVASIDFVVGQGGDAFDLWVDDLALLCRDACPTN